MKTKQYAKKKSWCEAIVDVSLMAICKTLIRKGVKEVTPGCPSHQFKDTNSVLPVPLSRIAHRGIGHRLRIAYSFLPCAMRKWKTGNQPHTLTRATFCPVRILYQSQILVVLRNFSFHLPILCYDFMYVIRRAHHISKSELGETSFHSENIFSSEEAFKL